MISIPFKAPAIAAILFGASAVTPVLADPAAIIITTPADTQAASLSVPANAASEVFGVVDVLLLENSQAEGGKFEQFLAVIFKDEASRDGWKKSLKKSKTDAMNIRRADVLTHGEIWPRDTKVAVFKVNHYEPSVDSKTYDGFADGYIRPLMEGQVSADIMTRYTMFYEHGDGGLVWSLYEYASQEALESAGEIKSGIRANLTENDTSYRDYHPIKDTLRVGGGETYAIAVE